MALVGLMTCLPPPSLSGTLIRCHGGVSAVLMLANARRSVGPGGLKAFMALRERLPRFLLRSLWFGLRLVLRLLTLTVALTQMVQIFQR